MSYRQPGWTAARRTRSSIFAALIVVSAALAGFLGYESMMASSSATSPIVEGPPRRPLESVRHISGPGWADGVVDRADGVIPDGVTIFDDAYPAVSNLDPALLDALRRAATDAGREGIVFSLHSGWRSPEYQEQLLDEAISEYGSREEAARWVATPKTSPHVSGDAVDIDSPAATAWLSEHGAAYGLCRIYGNEPWHYELRSSAIDHGCPPIYADPTQDPRMQR
jgi:zinc D-Ala-D-Ala carboxypeptidase